MLRHVTSSGRRAIACEMGGEGPPLVMVHGAGSARWGFDLVRPHLERAFHGLGARSPWSWRLRGRATGYSLEREFDDVVAVVREAGSDAFLFGHSYGGLVSAGAAVRLGRLPRLVLYEPPMGGVLADDAWIERYEDQSQAGDRPTAVRAFMHDVGGYSHEEIDDMEGTPIWGSPRGRANGPA